MNREQVFYLNKHASSIPGKQGERKCVLVLVPQEPGLEPFPREQVHLGRSNLQNSPELTTRLLRNHQPRTHEEPRLVQYSAQTFRVWLGSPHEIPRL